MSSSPDDADDLNRAAILARRSRFLAAALAGATTAVSATACACLQPGRDSGPPQPDAAPSDSGARDSGLDASPADDAAADDAAADDAATDDAATDDSGGPDAA